MPYWQNCVHALRDKILPVTNAPWALLLAIAVVSLGIAPAARADAQRDPELRAIVSAAITAADCFPDKFESAVWYTLMEPKLHTLVRILASACRYSRRRSAKRIALGNSACHPDLSWRSWTSRAALIAGPCHRPALLA